MGKTFAKLFDSKKFITFVLGLISMAAAYLSGIDPTGALPQNIGELTMATVAAQGAKDVAENWGK